MRFGTAGNLKPILFLSSPHVLLEMLISKRLHCGAVEQCCVVTAAPLGQGWGDGDLPLFQADKGTMGTI